MNVTLNANYANWNGDFVKVLTNELELSTLAGGCFWGVEELIRTQPGVVKTQVGYIGGSIDQPLYPQVKLGSTGHAEAIQILFDPQKIEFKALLHLFFRLHDPTTLNRQGNDIGSQYRSHIFFYNDIQRKVAHDVISEVDQSGRWGKPIVTLVTEASRFWPAEEYHQKYLVKNPGGYTCHYFRD